MYGILVHDPLLPLHSKKWKIVYRVLRQLKKKNNKKIGISIYNTFELNNILDVFTPDIIQFPLNVFYQPFSDNKLLKELKKENRASRKINIFTRIFTKEISQIDTTIKNLE